MPKKLTPAVLARMTTRQRKFALEEQRMEGAAARLRKAAKMIDLAAIYHGDFAPETAAERIKDALRQIDNVRRYLLTHSWQVS